MHPSSSSLSEGYSPLALYSTGARIHPTHQLESTQHQCDAAHPIARGTASVPKSQIYRLWRFSCAADESQFKVFEVHTCCHDPLHGSCPDLPHTCLSNVGAVASPGLSLNLTAADAEKTRALVLSAGPSQTVCMSSSAPGPSQETNVCDDLLKPPCCVTAGGLAALPPPALCQGLAVLAQKLIHLWIRRAQQGRSAKGPRQHVLDVRLRQRLMLQQHLGQPVQVLLLLRLQAASSCSSTGALSTCNKGFSCTS